MSEGLQPAFAVSTVQTSGHVRPVLWGDFNSMGHPRYGGGDYRMRVRADSWELRIGQHVIVDDHESLRAEAIVVAPPDQSGRRYVVVDVVPDSFKDYPHA